MKRGHLIDGRTIAKIQELAKQGTKASKIPEALGVSVKAVRKYGKMPLEVLKHVAVEAPKAAAPKVAAPKKALSPFLWFEHITFQTIRNQSNP